MAWLNAPTALDVREERDPRWRARRWPQSILRSSRWRSVVPGTVAGTIGIGLMGIAASMGLSSAARPCRRSRSRR